MLLLASEVVSRRGEGEREMRGREGDEDREERERGRVGATNVAPEE